MDSRMDTRANVPARLFPRASIRRRNTINVQRPQSISRIDVPPALDTSIHAIDTLFQRIQASKEDEDGDNGSVVAGYSPLSLVPSTRSSLGSADTATELVNRTEEYYAAHQRTKENHLASNDTMSQSYNRLSSSSDHIPTQQQHLLMDQLLDTLFPHPPANTKPYHAYFVVATMDGIAAIPTLYMCPTAACEAKFRQFDELCVHWQQHPWNRRSVLVPVMAGGIRRLSFWQHKRVFVRSLIRGHHVDAASGRPSTAHRRSAAESDYGDIRLLGPCSYFVSPKIVSIEQLHAWEALRPAIK